MFYITKMLPVMYHQMSFENFLNADVYDDDVDTFVRNPRETSTRTEEVSEINDELNRKINVKFLTNKLNAFNEKYAGLSSVPDRHSLYREFRIPKRSGGLRKISAPNEELMETLRELKIIFERNFGALYHTNAFAYIKKRSTIDAVKRHQYNESNWFGKYDLHDFFGSTTLEFVLHMLSMIYPFNFVIDNAEGKAALAKALDLAFLDGGLPQGTPISPLITNVMMIPVDFKLTQILRDYKKQHFVYTRYADDFIISSKYDFKFREIESLIVDTLNSFGAPFTINAKKTRYGSRTGSNWNLGVMLNSDNKITVGYQKKRQFKTMLFNYAMDRKNGNAWPLEDVQHMEGLRSYYRMVEGEEIDNIVTQLSQKVGVDIIMSIKSDLGRS